MLIFLKKNFDSRLTFVSILLFASSILGGLLGYVYQVVTGRMLGENDFGLFVAVMALFGVLSSPMGGLTMMISRRVSEYRAKNQSEEIESFFAAIYFWVILIGILLFIAGYFGEPFFQKYLKTQNSIIVYFLYGLLFVSIFPAVNTAFLQGFQKFHFLALFGPSFFLLKILYTSLLIFLGLGVAGAIFGSLLAVLTISFLTFIAITSEIKGREIKSREIKSFLLNKHLSLKYGAPVMLANISFAMMTNLDMVLVNYFFTSKEAGIYAAASVLGKAVIFLPHSIVVAFFPTAVENHTLERSSKKLLIQSISLAALLSGLAALFYLFFNRQIIDILFGEAYFDAASILKYYGLAIFPLAFAMILESFLIAKNRILLSYLFVAAAPFQIIAVYFFHESLLQVVLIMGITGLIVTCMGFLAIFKPYNKINKI
jgi:O-antigen/teichoic acid export membrane protein